MNVHPDCIIFPRESSMKMQKRFETELHSATYLADGVTIVSATVTLMGESRNVKAEDVVAYMATFRPVKVRITEEYLTAYAWQCSEPMEEYTSPRPWDTGNKEN